MIEQISPAQYHKLGEAEQLTIFDNSIFGDCISKGRVAPVWTNGYPVYRLKEKYEDPTVTIRNGLVFVDQDFFPNSRQAKAKSVDGFVPAGVITPHTLMLLNGDSDANDLVEVLNNPKPKYPTFSLSCLSKFFQKNPRNGEDAPSKLQASVARMIADGGIVVVDFIPDENRNLTKTQREQRRKYKRNPKKYKPPVPPQPGFTDVEGRWHRPATVLFLVEKTGAHILSGQDEGSYFACELQPGEYETVAEAFASLMPESIQKIGGIKRQGEWYIVPWTKPVPPITEALIFADNNANDQFCLPVEHVDSNPHCLHGDPAMVLHDGTILAKDGSVDHEQHSEVSFDGWHYFVRNTAVRSFGADNVD